MNQQFKAILRRLSRELLVAFMILTPGCAGRAERMREMLGHLSDPRLDEAIRRNIEVTGGIDNWARLVRIEGEAIATVYETDNGKTLIEQQHLIIPAERVAVTVVSNEPAGKLREHLDSHGRVEIVQTGAEGPTIEEDKTRLFGAGLKLFLEGQALTGTSFVLREGLTLRYNKLERKGGRLSHKVEIAGRLLQRDKSDQAALDDLLVMWINADTFLVERLWLRYQKPQQPDKFAYLAVHLGDYQAVPGGLLLPRRLEFVPSDSHQQFSRRHILILEFQRLQATQKKTNKGHS